MSLVPRKILKSWGFVHKSVSDIFAMFEDTNSFFRERSFVEHMEKELALLDPCKVPVWNLYQRASMDMVQKCQFGDYVDSAAAVENMFPEYLKTIWASAYICEVYHPKSEFLGEQLRVDLAFVGDVEVGLDGSIEAQEIRMYRDCSVSFPFRDTVEQGMMESFKARFFGDFDCMEVTGRSFEAIGGLIGAPVLPTFKVVCQVMGPQFDKIGCLNSQQRRFREVNLEAQSEDEFFGTFFPAGLSEKEVSYFLNKNVAELADYTVRSHGMAPLGWIHTESVKLVRKTGSVLRPMDALNQLMGDVDVTDAGAVTTVVRSKK